MAIVMAARRMGMRAWAGLLSGIFGSEIINFQGSQKKK
ncbi:MAG: hypothetical protein ETSY2_20890 [Candidatus Entotheonella gemina]|uniref:Uncharacterized protein n=1 Tax=Candidatus Entotheonella gemina TaxID=1429439 RepID=W4M7C1_9BACT|nr:MAG: hypothetical protein ETSY2_20890 [Candidatus Entotheonella gemina]